MVGSGIAARGIWQGVLTQFYRSEQEFRSHAAEVEGARSAATVVLIEADGRQVGAGGKFF